MRARTEQDDDITLYTYDELLVMKARWISHQDIYPFNIQEIEAEIERRNPKKRNHEKSSRH